MKRTILASSIILASITFGGTAYACGMHGGSFGWGEAQWKTYDPQASIIDPSLIPTEGVSPMFQEALPQIKARPSFSNAANTAAIKAKAKLADKDVNGLSPKKADTKTSSAKRVSLIRLIVIALTL